MHFPKKGEYGEMGSLFVNPVFLMPKIDYVKLVIDARYLNSVTDLIKHSWLLEPVQMIVTRVNGKNFLDERFILRLPSSTFETGNSETHNFFCWWTT